MKEFIRILIVAVITLEARLVLKRFAPKIILVTGSVGKTSTKDATYTALAGSVFVRKSEKSYNSDVGVPLTVLGIPNGWGNPFIWARNIVEGFLLLLVTTRYPQWLIVEVGADRPGDISRSLAWLTPQVVIATHIPLIPVHVEYYQNPEEVFAEEAFMLSQVAAGGTAVVNAHDERLMAYTLPDGVKRITYGAREGADMRISRMRTLTKSGMPVGVAFDVGYQGARAHVSLSGVLGMSHVLAATAGIAGAVAAGASLDAAAARFMSHVAPPGRMRVLSGVKGTTLIDDTYNASPVATEEALKALKDAPVKGKRIAILADMLELGSYSAEEHEKVGRAAAESADLVVAVGVRAKRIQEGALGAGKPDVAVAWFERGPDAASYVLSTIAEGDLVLVKGSQSMRMERVVKALMLEPGRAKELLCRQDDEWLSR